MDRGDSHGAALELEVHGPITVRSAYMSPYSLAYNYEEQQTNKQNSFSAQLMSG